MDFTVKQVSGWGKNKADCLIIPITNTKNLPTSMNVLAADTLKFLKALNAAGDIKKAIGSHTLIHTPDANFPRVLFWGVSKELDMAHLITGLKHVRKQLESASIKNVALLADTISCKHFTAEQLFQQIAFNMENGDYKYDHTLSRKAKKSALKKLIVITDKKAKPSLNEGKSMAQGVKLARELGNLPANICTPGYLANQAKSMAKKYPKLTAKVLNEAEMKKLKMGALLSVTAGTVEPAKLIIMEYKGGKAGDKPQVLVGKGVTFDSGGISLKPGAKMDEMKYDMCGAASVFGTIKAIAELGLKKNVVGIVGAVENLPSGHATKPGDVVTSMSGQTIEILNTDAEGRLVLCDALTYAGKYKPAAVIDIATLTGACVVALGKHASGLYSNDDKLGDKLRAAGDHTYDRAWPMPLWDEYNKQLKSNFADMANIGGPEGGSVTAACFLSRFTKDYTWAHLDIAGAAWTGGGAKGGTGRPVSLLTQYLIDC